MTTSGPDHLSNLTFTGRLARWSAEHRWLVLAGSLVVVILAVAAIAGVGTETRGDGGGVGDSGKGSDLLDERFGGPPLPGEVRTASRLERLIFSNPSMNVDDPAFKETVDRVMGQVRTLPLVTDALSYYDTGDEDLVADDGNAVLALVVLEDPSARSSDDIEIGGILDEVETASLAAPGFEIELVSFQLIDDELDDILSEDFSRILVISLIVGLVILVLAFRAVVAAVVPLAMAISAIFSALGIAALVSQVYPLVDLYAEILLLMGLAVGIDYSLFVISRFRTERRAGWPKLDAITVASNTTGRAVFYAGITVLLSLTGLTLTRDQTFISLALGAIIVVFVAVVASLSLLPALLAVLGDGVNRLRVPFLGGEDSQQGFWGAISDRVLAHPAGLATATAAALVVIAIPAFSLNLGFNSGADSLPDAVGGKRAVELLERHFSSSLLEPATVVIDAPDVQSPEVRGGVDVFLALVDRNDAFLGPINIAVNRAGNLMRINVPLAGSIDDEASEDAVKLLRSVIIPQSFSGTGATVFVTGQTADSIDFRDRMIASAPFVFVFVLGLSFLLLLVMFRSLIIPLKAILLNLLAVAAVYGVLVAVFQWGWGIQLLGSEESGIVESWLPLFLFGILFGLSMDYHMLLLNRIKEAHDEGLSNEEAVSAGIRQTAGQITSAAAIMVAVFITFATSRILGLQQFGLGLAVAVLIDATVIRVVLLPASMKLLGDWNWYLPRSLRWIPSVSAEGVRVSPRASLDRPAEPEVG